MPGARAEGKTQADEQNAISHAGEIIASARPNKAKAADSTTLPITLSAPVVGSVRLPPSKVMSLIRVPLVVAVGVGVGLSVAVGVAVGVAGLPASIAGLPL